MIVYILASACAITVVLIASGLFRRLRHGLDDSAPDGPSISHAGGMLSALFLIALAIAIVVPWTTADAARGNTFAETQSITEAYWVAGQLPAADAMRTRIALRGYSDLVRGPEWRLMRDKGRLSPDGWTRLDRLRRDAVALRPRNDQAREARGALLGYIAEISAARRQREMDARTTPPVGLLILTLITGTTVILLPFMAGSRPRGTALLPLGLMAALLATAVYLTIDISHPFSGALAVSPEAFDDLQGDLQRISGGG
ncbi:DUF4239 domain-containing protein [Actinomadura graeca]|uniref:DUF4239 domain-containing protein n=1 Tax=Actinomadura graeca TaxID=2750812 RepID=A0ABX8QR07_9ACTN|nr:DUF4239 domain-containing protein [Actinomadura graeca]QXJ19842.1 DUF4239 domain-containing protein [Actinomadura graeca]